MEQIKNELKDNVVKKVIRNENELNKIIIEIKNEEIIGAVHKKISSDNIKLYTELDNEEIKSSFKEFNLLLINNELENFGYVAFIIYDPVMDFLWNYNYGFYYSNCNVPINIFWSNKECSEEVDDSIPFFGSYKYKTKEITDNWFYFEYIFLPSDR